MLKVTGSMNREHFASLRLCGKIKFKNQYPTPTGLSFPEGWDFFLLDIRISLWGYRLLYWYHSLRVQRLQFEG
jgi:hypothetical protein